MKFKIIMMLISIIVLGGMKLSSAEQDNNFIVETILYEGLVNTDQQVIKKALTFKGGDTVSQTSLNRSKERLMNLTCFDKVNVVREDNSNHVMITVIEKGLPLTWFIWPLGGALFGDVTYWNLFNRGIIMHAYIQPIQQFNLDYKLPRLFNSEYYFKHSINYNKISRERYPFYYSYDHGQTIGNSVSIGHELITDLLAELDYGIKWTDWDEAGPLSEQWHSLGWSLIWDNQDNLFFPKKGLYQRLTCTMDRLVQGNHHHAFYNMKSITDYRQPLVGPINLRVKIEGGLLNVVDDRYLPFQETKRVGRTNAIRGYHEGIQRNDFPVLKNQYYFIGSTELSWFMLDSLRLFSFLETGNSWYSRESFTDEPDFAKLVGTGLGIEWSILKSGYNVHFSVGYPLKPLYQEDQPYLMYHMNLTSALDKLFY